jgi:formate hydrogenlyase subunit 4
MLGLSIMLVMSFLFVGIINRVKSIFSGRKGPGIFQNLYDITRLAKKQTIYSSTTGLIFKLAPTVYLSTVLCAGLFMPFNGHDAVLSFEGDFVFFAYLLALGKFFMIIAALDTGSPFEGMGANREALYSMLVEPAFFILIGSFAMFTGKTSFHDIFYNFLNLSEPASIFLVILASYILIQIMMIENSRMPVDDPKTHLELTMIHEVMILDYTGFDLAMIFYTTSLKFVLYSMLIVNLVLIAHIPIVLEIAIFFMVQIGLAVFAGGLESFVARERMKKNPNFIFTLTVLAIILFFGIILIMNKI